MVVVIVLLLTLVALFVGSFLSKRRFGVLGLGLAAGAVISPIWGETAGYLVSMTGVLPEGPLVNAVAAAVIILIPAILFMFHGYTYGHIVFRVIGSVLFTVLAAAFLIGPIATAVSLTGPVGSAYQWLDNNHTLIISIGVALAVADFLVGKSVHKVEKKRR